MRRIVNFEHLYGIEIEPDLNKNEEWRLFWTALHETMESFAFGHEYGHFLRRHALSNDETTLKKWSNEYDADRVAMDLVAILTIQTTEKDDRPIAILITLLGCYLILLLFLLIEEFSFKIASPSDSHPPTIFRYAHFKRVCLNQLGSGGLAALDKYIASIDELADFYISQSSRSILNDSIEANTILTRIERSFQKSMLWAVMQRTHNEMIVYLGELYRKIDKLQINRRDFAEQNVHKIETREILEVLPYIGSEVLSSKGAEQLLDISLRKHLLTKESILSIIKNCSDIYRMNKAVLKIPSH